MEEARTSEPALVSAATSRVFASSFPRCTSSSVGDSASLDTFPSSRLWLYWAGGARYRHISLKKRLRVLLGTQSLSSQAT